MERSDGLGGLAEVERSGGGVGDLGAVERQGGALLEGGWSW